MQLHNDRQVGECQGYETEGTCVVDCKEADIHVPAEGSTLSNVFAYLVSWDLMERSCFYTLGHFGKRVKVPENMLRACFQGLDSFSKMTQYIEEQM